MELWGKSPAAPFILTGECYLRMNKRTKNGAYILCSVSLNKSEGRIGLVSWGFWKKALTFCKVVITCTLGILSLFG
jgi:hypothetical protein